MNVVLRYEVTTIVGWLSFLIVLVVVVVRIRVEVENDLLTVRVAAVVAGTVSVTG